MRRAYLDYLCSRAAERPVFVELFGPLIGLDAEWRQQGATEDEIALTAFGFDYCRRHSVAVNSGLSGRRADRQLEETAEHIIYLDCYDRKVKLCKGKATIPLPMEYPVRTMDDLLKIKPRYQYHSSRIPAAAIAAAKAARDAGAVTTASIPGGFDEPRQLLGEEELSVAYYESPELIHDMLSIMGTTAQRVLAAVSAEVPIDILSVHEDLAGKSGPLVGPTQVAEFIKPYYRAVWDLLQNRSARIFQQDSDGNINPVIQAFADAGVNCMYPMEPAAGMDIVKMRERFPNLIMMGGIDKHVVRESKQAIRRELEYKLSPAMLGGGIVFGLDHRIPNGTPIDLYRYYVATARELLGLDAQPAPGWQRMAF